MVGWLRLSVFFGGVAGALAGFLPVFLSVPASCSLAERVQAVFGGVLAWGFDVGLAVAFALPSLIYAAGLGGKPLRSHEPWLLVALPMLMLSAVSTLAYLLAVGFRLTFHEKPTITCMGNPPPTPSWATLTTHSLTTLIMGAMALYLILSNFGHLEGIRDVLHVGVGIVGGTVAGVLAGAFRNGWDLLGVGLLIAGGFITFVPVLTLAMYDAYLIARDGKAGGVARWAPALLTAAVLLLSVAGTAAALAQRSPLHTATLPLIWLPPTLATLKKRTTKRRA